MPSATSNTRSCECRFARRTLRAISDLQADPRPPGCKMLKGAERLYRIRVGDYRIIYEIDDNRLRLIIARIRHRSDVYR
ncbi:MAG: type II toxin-antitoxin system RelE family toxin [Candidatus Binataceae bacterium]